MEPIKYRKTDQLIGFLTFFYIIPIILLSFGYLPFWSRHSILFIAGLILVAYAINAGVSSQALGFTTKKLKKSLVYNGIFLAAFLIIGAFLNYTGVISGSGYDSGLWFFAFYVIISAPLQEFIFRSLMFYELDIFVKGHGVIKIILSALVYSMAHAMYQNMLVLVGTFLVGLIWGVIYSKTRNYWGIALSHAIIGAISVFWGFV